MKRRTQTKATEKFCSCQWQSNSPHFTPLYRKRHGAGGGAARRATRRLPFRTRALESRGWGRSPPRVDRREGDTEPGCSGVWPPSEHAVRGSLRRERKSKSARKATAGVPSPRNPFGRSQKPNWVLDSFWKKLSKRRLSPPPKSCTPVLTPPCSPVTSLWWGLLKGPSGAPQVIPDGPGRHAGAGTLAAGLCAPPPAPGLPMAPFPAPRTPPGRGGRERRGRTASRGGEPEVQGGAPGNPSRASPGGAGAGGKRRAACGGR